MYVWGVLDVCIGKHIGDIFIVLSIFIATTCLCLSCLCEHWSIILNILWINYLCGVDQESVEYPTWGGITFFDPCVLFVIVASEGGPIE